MGAKLVMTQFNLHTCQRIIVVKKIGDLGNVAD